MPRKDREKYNEYMKNYMAGRYEKRRNAAIEQLGGECIECGWTECLEFDHIDPKQKSFYIGKAFASASEEKLQKELVKCQLLCKFCHEDKTYKR